MDSNGSATKELFTDLDPLGTGKSRPYVDKKDFFSELKTSASPKLAGNLTTSQEMAQTNVGSMDQTQQQQQQQQQVGPTESSCPTHPSSSSVLSFVHNKSSTNSSQRSSLRSSSTHRHFSGQQPQLPTPPPRSGSELTYGHLDPSRRGMMITSSADINPSLQPSHGIKGFGFSAHLSDPNHSTTNTTNTTNPTNSSNTHSLLSSYGGTSTTPLVYSSATMSRAALSGHGHGHHHHHHHHSHSSSSNNPATNIASLAASWRTEQQQGSRTGSSLHDTRLYHTLGRPMTTFTTKAPTSFIQTEGGDSLKVSLPPQESNAHSNNANPNIPSTAAPTGTDSTRPGSQQDEDSYGSIPHLEASPRRYNNKHKEMCEFQYDTTGPTLSVPVRCPGDGSSPNSDIPPKLPEKPSKKTTSSSPPPLPPKKPMPQYSQPFGSQQHYKTLTGVHYLNRPHTGEEPPPDIIGGHDIYDFPPMPMVGSMKLDQKVARQCITDILQTKPNSTSMVQDASKQPHTEVLTVEALSRMSVMELNEKMQSGQLPSSMKGLSIFELVEYIGKHMKQGQEQHGTTNQPTLEPGAQEQQHEAFLFRQLCK